MEPIKIVDAGRIAVVSHGEFINCLVYATLPDTKIGHTLGNLQYHKIVFDDQGKVVEAALYQEWSKLTHVVLPDPQGLKLEPFK